MFRKICFIGSMAALSWVGVVRADTVVAVNSRAALGATDSIDWGQKGPAFTNLSNPFTALSAGGLSVTVSQATGNTQRRDEGNGWVGNFALGDHLLWTQGGGPLTIDFATPVSAAGAQVQENIFGTFTGQLNATAYSPSGANLGTATFAGLNNGAENNTNPFVGIEDLSGANIASIVFSITSPANQDFAINTVSLATSPAVPLPSAAWGGMALLAVIGLFESGRRLKRSPQI
jgi:hypothetical protein